MGPIMRTVTKTCPSALTVVSLLVVTLAISLSEKALAVVLGGLAVTKSGNDLVLSFPTTSPDLYTVQTSPDLLQWDNLQSAIHGDGTVKTVTVTNGTLGGIGFYRLLIQMPAKLSLPQANAFAILGYSCGGIQEKAYVTGFDPTTGFPIGDVHLSTSCSTGKAGSPPSVHTAWAAVTWDFAGNVVSSAALSNAPAVNTNFIATDVYSDTIYNAGSSAYLAVPPPAAPTGVTAVQSGDQFQVSWTPNRINPVAVTSSTLTATPVNSAASILTTTVAGAATTGVIASLQPQTTYQVTVVNKTISGSSPPSAPISVGTSPASIPPSAPPGVTAHWTNLDPTGTTDTIVAAWQAADPGNSPIDQYRITIVGSDGAGTFTQTVSGTTLTASFTVDFIPNWSVTVQAHNAVGWGPSSTAVTLGGL
jgi:hypothetical protein